MSWREQLRDASFRGAPFKVDEAGRPLGRRVDLHEYPLKDTAFAEDLGKVTPVHSISCVVIGDDYMAQRQALEDALNKPGAGTLVHPFLGTRRVVPTRAYVTERTSELGAAFFQIDFAEAVDNLQPSAVDDTRVQAAAQAADSSAGTAARFGSGFTVTGAQSWVADSGRLNLGSAISQIVSSTRFLSAAGDQLFGISAQAASIQADAEQLLQTPASLATSVQTLMGMVADAAAEPADALAAFSSLIGFQAADVIQGSTSGVSQAQQNQALMAGLVRWTAAAQAVVAIAGMTWDSYDAAVAARDDLAELIDGLALDAGNQGDDEAFRSLSALRLAMIRDVTARGASLARLFDYPVERPTNALLLAYQVYGDPNRDLEIVARNDLPEPGFIRAGVVLQLATPEAADG